MSTRKEILQMLADGKIDVARATDLLNDPDAESRAAVPEVPQPEIPPAPPGATRKGNRRWLHIHVSDLNSGGSRVRVNVPLGLVEFGLKIGARFTDEMNIHMTQDLIDALRDEALTGTLVEVEDIEDNERVHIFVD